MKTLALLSLALPFGGEQPRPAPVAEWRDMQVAGLTLMVGPSKGKGLGLSGITVEMPVKAAGGSGVAVVRQGLTRDIDVRITEVDAAELAKLFDLPAWLAPKLVGKVGLVELTVKGDALTLKASKFRIPGDFVSRVDMRADLKTRAYAAKLYVFGGLAEVTGTLPPDGPPAR